jgi:hypothetical protein
MADQLSLLPDDPKALAEALEVSGEYTAERVRAARPEACAVAVALLQKGFGLLCIAEALHMSVNTVQRLRDDAGIKPEDHTVALGRAAGMVAALSAERLISRLSDPETSAEIPARDLAIIHGVGVDKSQLLSGGPTVRVEHTDGPSLEAIMEEHRRLSAAIDVTSSVEIGPCAGACEGRTNGLGGREGGAKGGPEACGIDGHDGSMGMRTPPLDHADRRLGPPVPGASSESLSVVEPSVCRGSEAVRENHHVSAGEKGTVDAPSAGGPGARA